MILKTLLFVSLALETVKCHVTKLRRENATQLLMYQPSFISSPMCQYMTSEQCEEEDSIARRAYEAEISYRLALDTSQRPQLRQLQAQRNISNVKPLVLLVRFKDHADRVLPDASYFQALCDGASGPGTINPVGSIMDYFEEQSGGKYARSSDGCTVIDWKTSDMTEAEATQGASGLLGSVDTQKFFHSVLDEVEREGIEREGVFFWSTSGFDAQMDGPDAGFIDALLVIHSGLAAQEGGEDCSGEAEKNRMWSQGHSSSDDSGWEGMNMAVSSYSISSAFENCDITKGPTKMGVVTHEWIHTLRVPDLYGSTSVRVGGIGGFGIMASVAGQGNDGALPGSMSPWTRQRIGWLEYTNITMDGTYRVAEQEAFRIDHPRFGLGEYLLVEYRRPTSFDGNMLGNGGIVIYHVDDNMPNQARPGFPGQIGWPQNGDHYRVAVLQADGLYDLEQDRNRGDAGDFWTNGMFLGPGIGGKHPNTDSYQNGQIARTGLTIYITSNPGGSSMTFIVDGFDNIPNPPQQTDEMNAPSRAPTLSPVTASPVASPPSFGAVPDSPPTLAPVPTPSNPVASPPSFGTLPDGPPTLAPLASSTTSPTTLISTTGAPATAAPTGVPCVPSPELLCTDSPTKTPMAASQSEDAPPTKAPFALKPLNPGTNSGGIGLGDTDIDGGGVASPTTSAAVEMLHGLTIWSFSAWFVFMMI